MRVEGVLVMLRQPKGELGKLLQDRIDELKISYSELGRRVKVGHAQIQNVIFNPPSKPNTNLILAIADQLELDHAPVLKALGISNGENINRSEILADLEAIKITLDDTISKIKRMT